MIAAKASGKVHPMIADAPDLPGGCELLWADFLELHAARTTSGMGPARIGYRDIESWQRVTGANLKPWQIAAIRKADEAWFAVRAEK